MSFNNPNPSRLSLARRRRGFSKTDLAAAIGVTADTVRRYELGTPIPLEKIGLIAKTLNFPEEFFFGPDVDEPRRDNASFRGMASKSGKVMDAALASGAFAYLLDDWISKSYDRPEPHLLDLQGETPETAAMLVRQHWGLGEKPIKNMVQLLEVNGVRVFSLAESNKEVDAFSLWRDGIPYVFLNRFKSAERSRFDAAHELAHLCLHRHGGASSTKLNSEIEKEANQFASSFLMPMGDVKAVCGSHLYGVDSLIDYKRRWGVSVAALNYRLSDLGLIGHGKATSNYVELSRRGWLKSEPFGLAREQSTILQDIVDDLLKSGITKTKIADELCVAPVEIEALLFGLANMVSIDGFGGKTAPSRVSLKVIK
jgi:Zn-dependent peptidase ImmA (M78 family)/DNA-binding XRE family transcriptional regulator